MAGAPSGRVRESRLSLRPASDVSAAPCRSVALTDLLSDLAALPEPSLADIAGLLHRELGVEDFAPWVRFDPRQRTRTIVHRDERAEVVVIAWLPGQSSSVHDHGASVCAFRVLAGRATETLHAPLRDGARPLYSRVHEPGSITTANTADVHRLENGDGQEALVTVHIYAPPLGLPATATTGGAPALPDRVDVAIVGGGFSGTALAVHLARTAGSTRSVAVFEASGRVGRGLAYRAEPWHRLNVPASGMSLFPDEPGHFLAWARARLPGVTADSFVPRARYGQYVEEMFAELAGDTPVIAERVVDVARGPSGWVLTTSEGRRVEATDVVVATGNGRPGVPPFVGAEGMESTRYAGDPWAPTAVAGLGADDPVLVLGTGLTMVDVVLSLRARGHRGPVLALSRRGLLPAPHVSGAQLSSTPLAVDPERWLRAAEEGLGALVRTVRTDVAVAREGGHPWQLVLNEVRRVVPQLWSRLAPQERSRFLRHVRPWWDTHRHRLPPDVALLLRQWRATGTLDVRAGRVLEVVWGDEAAWVSYRLRGATEVSKRPFARVINAMGTDGQPPSGVVPFELRADADLRALDAAGQPVDGLWVLGPALRADFWEATAVPELSRLAATLARRLVRLPSAPRVPTS